MTTSDAEGRSEELVRRAFRATNGEWAGVREDAITAAQSLATTDRAELGGEAWLIGDGGHWTGLLPARDGGPDLVGGWDCERQPGEAWRAYCLRAAREAVAVLRRLRLQDSVPPDLAPRLRYTLTYVSEEG